MYKIEIWQYRSLSDVYVADEIQDILAWFKWEWLSAYDDGYCLFNVYRNGIELEFDELYELGFY